MPTFRISNENSTTYSIAVSLVNQQLSVIPIRQNKVAAESWKTFQSQLPTTAILHHWFVGCAYPALAVVCGSISRLIILDFDTEAQFTRFQSEHPTLTDTLTIGTRRGWHLWYRVPPNVHVKSRHRDGVDLLGEGKYGVCPPSTIDGHTYTIDQALPILELTNEDIQHIVDFVGPEIITDRDERDTALPLSTPELLGLYRAHAHIGNRNNALFYAALAARDSGWSCADVIATLADVYVSSGRAGENPVTRYREAVHTIESAFSRPARTVLENTPHTLPNTIKEALCQQGLTCTVRVIEALWQRGYQSGNLVHPEILWRELEGLVGRHSIYKALKATLEDGSWLFEPVLVFPRTFSGEASASHLSTDSDKMLLSVRKNRQKPNLGGRPAIFYRVPRIPELFKRLGITSSRTRDELPNLVLRSAKNTRKHLHESLLRRRPGRYGRTKLAERVGVCVRTIDTYHNEFKAAYPDFNKRHCYLETPLFWNNLKLIPSEDLLHNGIFLLDDTGKRYPAKEAIAVMLLKRKRKVSLVRQTWNEYWFGSRFSPPSYTKPSQQQENQPEPWREPAKAYWDALQAAPETRIRRNLPQISDLAESGTHRSSEGKTRPKSPKSDSKLKERPSHNPRRRFPYAEDEELVERLQQRINRLCKQPGQAISKRTLRQLIVKYGKAAVKEAVKGVEARDYVDANPVGFLVVMLRSDSKRDKLKALLRQLG